MILWKQACGLNFLFTLVGGTSENSDDIKLYDKLLEPSVHADDTFGFNA